MLPLKATTSAREARATFEAHVPADQTSKPGFRSLPTQAPTVER
jgi:hypothetical protein